jgi:hypothetical protein
LKRAYLDDGCPDHGPDYYYYYKVPYDPYTTRNSGFAESLKLSAKGLKHSATPLPSVALITGPTGNFFSATFLCRAPQLQALGTGYAESPQWAVGQKK